MDSLSPDDKVAVPVQCRLFIGSMLAEQQRDDLLALHVTHILQVCAVIVMDEMLECKHQHKPVLVVSSGSPNSKLRNLLPSCLDRSEPVLNAAQVGEGLVPSHRGQFSYRVIHVQDEVEEDIVAHFPKCFSFIDGALKSEAGSCLVHCAAGRSRSAAVVVGYLMWSEGLSMDDALAQVRAARPCVALNPGFVDQLRVFESLEVRASVVQSFPNGLFVC